MHAGSPRTHMRGILTRNTTEHAHTNESNIAWQMINRTIHLPAESGPPSQVLGREGKTIAKKEGERRRKERQNVLCSIESTGARLIVIVAIVIAIVYSNCI